jgi:hypothetical protein
MADYMLTNSPLFEALAKSRSRGSWNDRLTHWERPASDTEEAQIQRAATMVRNAMTSSAWLTAECVSVEPQGSYFNNTNVRQTADQDLRAVHPYLRVEYAQGLDPQAVDHQLGIYSTGQSLAVAAARMRSEINMTLGAKFGFSNLDISGKKATRVLALPGSRAPVDVVPVFRYLWIMHNDLAGISQVEGVSILSQDGSWTNNFPAQHNANGIAKRAATQHRFKKVVRSLKRIRDELVEHKQIGPKQAPSFLIECLTYSVENGHFLSTEPDQRYDRVFNVIQQMGELLDQPAWVQSVTEINGIKYLFHPTQPWTTDDARRFVQAAHARLLDV